MVNESIVKEWASKKKHIQDHLNRIEKRLKKYSKQKKHFQFRMKAIEDYEKRIRGSIKE